MPLSKAHKARTREKILDQAARLFREEGYGAVGIDRLMASAELTRGGFYNHFASKQALLREIVRDRHDLLARLKARQGTTRQALTQEAEAIIGGYLDPGNRDKIGRGCTLATLSQEIARGEESLKTDYEAAVRAIGQEFARSYPDPRDPDPRGMAVLSLLVGAITLARAMADEAVIALHLEACREQAVALLRQGQDG